MAIDTATARIEVLRIILMGSLNAYGLYVFGLDNYAGQTSRLQLTGQMLAEKPDFAS